MSAYPYAPGFELVEENLRQAMRFFSRATAAGDVQERPGLLLICSGVNYAVFNAALLATPVPGWGGGLEERMRAARKYFSPLRLRWSCWLCEGLLDRETRQRTDWLMSRSGLYPVSTHIGMIATALAPPRRRLPKLTTRLVEDAATRQGFCRVTAAAFDLPEDISRAIYASERPWQGDVIAWVGYLEGQAVATAATCTVGPVIGVYSVATLPEYRRRGLGEAVMRHAVAEAHRASGIQQSVLQSTVAGLSLYEKLGYRRVTRIVVYATG